jgi:hypothetical protein
MDRRSFLTRAGITGTAALGGITRISHAAESDGHDYYELRRYLLETAKQQEAMNIFLKNAFIPAANRLGIEPVGVFRTPEEISPLYVLLRHRTVNSCVTLTEKLLTDKTFMSQGKSFLESQAENPGYQRMESSLLVAFSGIPKLQTPITSEGRVFQLRMYESPSIITGQKKIEMFNQSELDIFRKTGLNPVFFGESLLGSKMPNLTYMLVFNSMEEQKANWQRFIADPDWQRLRAIPEYADDKILCGITNIALLPMECSQI